MPVKQRTSIKKVKADVEHASNLRCCVCHKLGHQIHHLDSNTANNAFENFALLCFTCHSRASVTGGQARKLGFETIKRYREEWYELVRSRRSGEKDRWRRRSKSDRASPEPIHEVMLEALQVHEVKKIGYKLRRADWAKMQATLDELWPYTTELHARESLRVEREIISVLYEPAGKTRMGMPAEVAQSIAWVACNALPLWNLVGPVHWTVSAGLSELLLSAAGLGHALAYDGALYRHDLSVVDAGADVLWTILRFAHLNHVSEPKKHALEYFEGAIDGAKRSGGGDGFPDAVRWLEFRRADALAVGDDPLPKLPMDVEERVSRASRGA